MKLTDFLAVWGAALSTVVAGWNIYKDLIKRERVRVGAGFRIMFTDATDKRDVFVVNVTNLTDKVLSVTHVGGYKYHSYRWPRLLKFFQNKEDGGAFLLSFTTIHGSLPHKIEARHTEALIYTVTAEEFPTPLAQLFVVTSDGRTWYVPRQDIRNIRATTAKARAAEPSNPG